MPWVGRGGSSRGRALGHRVRGRVSPGRPSGAPGRGPRSPRTKGSTGRSTNDGMDRRTQADRKGDEGERPRPPLSVFSCVRLVRRRPVAAARMSGIGFSRRIGPCRVGVAWWDDRARWPCPTAVAILSACARSGARGYVLADAPPDERSWAYGERRPGNGRGAIHQRGGESMDSQDDPTTDSSSESASEERRSTPNSSGPQEAAGGMGSSSERVGHTGRGQVGTDGLRDTSPSDTPAERRPSRALVVRSPSPTEWSRRRAIPGWTPGTSTSPTAREPQGGVASRPLSAHVG